MKVVHDSVRGRFQVQHCLWRCLHFDRRKNFSVSVKNSKSQITNNKKITMTKIQNVQLVWVIGY